MQHCQHIRDKPDTVPSVYVSMNSECAEKLQGGVGMGPDHGPKQFRMVEDTNWYMNLKMREMGMPYWDADSVLRTPNRCDYLADGVHTAGYVNVFRAKMLLSYLCDENMNWRPDTVQAFL